MTMGPAEAKLLVELKEHDALVSKCARGELGWSDFESAYDNFYPRYPLDGHESDAQELLLTKVTADEYPSQRFTAGAGFIGSAEAVRRIQELHARYGG